MASSDHLGVVIALHLPRLPPPPPPPARWKVAGADWARYQSYLTRWAANYVPASNMSQLESDLLVVIHEAALAAIPTTRPGGARHADTWYYSPEVKELKYQLYQAH